MNTEQQFWVGILGTLSLSWVLTVCAWRKSWDEFTVVAVMSVAIFLLLFVSAWMLLGWRW